MKYTDRKITKDFIDLIKESSDPNQFTSTYQKAAGDFAGVAADVAADAAGLGILFKAAEAFNNVMGSQGAAKIAEMYPGMEIAGFLRSCAVFIKNLEKLKKEGNLDKDIVTMFNDALKECKVSRYKLIEPRKEAGVYPTVK